VTARQIFFQWVEESSVWRVTGAGAGLHCSGTEAVWLTPEVATTCEVRGD
jgi:hypothetical protein